jgi:hypothetical protein
LPQGDAGGKGGLTRGGAVATGVQRFGWFRLLGVVFNRRGLLVNNAKLWDAEVVVNRVFVETGEVDGRGNKKRRPITHRRIFLRRDGRELKFTVTKIKGEVKVRDHRVESCGDRAAWVDGVLTRQSKVVSNGRSLLPSEFVREASRFVGEDRAHALLVEAAYGASKL